MSYQSNYTRGQWLVICEACGRKYKNTELRQRWDGFMVCEDDWEPRQPQDFVRGVADYQAPPFTRPEQGDVFVPVTYIYDNDGLPFIKPVSSTAKVTLQQLRFRISPTTLVVSPTTSTLTTSITRLSRLIDGYNINTRSLG